MTYKMRIKFDNREWLVIDNIEYEGIRYYYIIEDISEKLERLKSLDEYEGTFNIEFIYKLENGNYKNVTDRKLIDVLLAIVGKNAILNENFDDENV